MTDEIQRELGALQAAVKATQEEVRGFATEVTGRFAAGDKVSTELKDQADKALAASGEAQSRLTELEQKVSRRAVEPPAAPQTLGQAVLASEEMKAAMERGSMFKGRVEVETKMTGGDIANQATITSGSVSGTSGTTALVVADRQDFVGIPRRPFTVRDLLMPGRTSSNLIEWPVQATRTNNAATVAENPGSAKPQSDMTWIMANAPVRTIAHWMKASKQILEDAPGLQSQIDGELRYGLAYAEEQQLLLGDGTGTNLNGLMTQATAYSATTTGVTEPTGVTKIDRLRLAMLQSALALYPPSGIVVSYQDWTVIEMTKDSQGRYIWSDPTNSGVPRLWGMPVVPSLAMTQNLFLVGAFKMAAQIFDRDDASVQISTEDQDNFVKNMVTILAEERLALAVRRSAALTKGNFTGAA